MDSLLRDYVKLLATNSLSKPFVGSKSQGGENVVALMEQGRATLGQAVILLLTRNERCRTYDMPDMETERSALF